MSDDLTTKLHRLAIAVPEHAGTILEAEAALSLSELLNRRLTEVLIDLQATIKKLSDELGRREPEEGVDA